MTILDLREPPGRQDLSCNEQTAGVTRAFTDMAVAVWREGDKFRAGLVEAPIRNRPVTCPTECCDYPDEAIDRLHERLVKDAEKHCATAGEHLSKLMGRIVPKPAPLDKSEDRGQR